MSKGGPKAPDPYATAAAQSQQNKQSILDSARVNQINQQTPFGSVTYTGAIGSPNRTQVSTLSPDQQQLLDTRTSLANAVAGNIPTSGLDFSALPSLPTSSDVPILPDAGVSFSTQLPTNFDQARQDTTKAQFDLAKNLLQPGFDQATKQLDTRLINQGIPLNSEAYNTAMGNLQRGQNETLTNAAYQAVGAGNQEQQNLFGQALSARAQELQAQGLSYDQALQQAQTELQAQGQQFGQGLAARQQGLNEATTAQTLPISQLASILSGAQVQTPTPYTPAQYQQSAPDITSLINQQYQNQAANQQANNSGLFGLAAAALPFILSDKKTKENIKKVGDWGNGIGMFSYNYKGDGVNRVGVIAQDVEKTLPEAVVDVGGLKAVNYDKLAGAIAA